MWITIVLIVLLTIAFGLKELEKSKSKDSEVKRTASENIVAYLLAIPTAVILLSYTIKLFWTMFMIPIFGLSEITLQQSLWLLFMIKVVLAHSNGGTK